jgi:hypothetical protein
VDYRTMFKGDNIQAAEFAGKVPTLTIKDVRLVRMEDEKKKTERDKGVVHFHETDRGWVLNRTNAESLAAMFGPETTVWHGKRVTLRAEMVKFGAEMTPGIRVVGSPDIPKPVHFELKLPRKRPQKMTMQITKPGKTPDPMPPQSTEEPPDFPAPTDTVAEPIPF